MLCQDPYVRGKEAFPCGKCFPCLSRRRQLWTHRLMLESLCHAESAFVTLTYAEDMLPKDMSVQPVELQLFMKRLRTSIEPKKVRFYGVGEYGDKSERPHYHVLLFGYGTCLRGRSAYSKLAGSCCSQCDKIRDLWGKGLVELGTVTSESVRYVCGYMTKNMRHRHDSRLKGREPEFARMSLRPGIGYYALDEISQSIMQYELENRDEVYEGVRVGKVVKPYGRYLRGKLHEMMGKEKLPYVDEEVLAMYEAASVATPQGGEPRRVLLRNMIADAGEQRVRNMMARAKLKGGKSL